MVSNIIWLKGLIPGHYDIIGQGVGMTGVESTVVKNEPLPPTPNPVKRLNETIQGF